ncbi:MAG TPA: hypothetical protein VFY79_12730 [Dehalococcoidia bacterium]|nr:hypothetical protein [Dehalococcoidia bacterium]
MHKSWTLWAAIAAMFVGTVAVVLGVLAFGGGGKQRGLVVRNESGQPVVVRFEHGTSLSLTQSEERTIGAKRGDYPQALTVSNQAGKRLWERQLTFQDLSDNSFRLVIGATGIIPTPPQTGG